MVPNTAAAAFLQTSRPRVERPASASSSVHSSVPGSVSDLDEDIRIPRGLRRQSKEATAIRDARASLTAVLGAEARMLTRSNPSTAENSRQPTELGRADGERLLRSGPAERAQDRWPSPVEDGATLILDEDHDVRSASSAAASVGRTLTGTAVSVSLEREQLGHTPSSAFSAASAATRARASASDTSGKKPALLTSGGSESSLLGPIRASTAGSAGSSGRAWTDDSETQPQQLWGSTAAAAAAASARATRMRTPLGTAVPESATAASSSRSLGVLSPSAVELQTATLTEAYQHRTGRGGGSESKGDTDSKEVDEGIEVAEPVLTAASIPGLHLFLQSHGGGGTVPLRKGPSLSALASAMEDGQHGSSTISDSGYGLHDVLVDEACGALISPLPITAPASHVSCILLRTSGRRVGADDDDEDSDCFELYMRPNSQSSTHLLLMTARYHSGGGRSSRGSERERDGSWLLSMRQTVSAKDVREYRVAIMRRTADGTGYCVFEALHVAHATAAMLASRSPGRKGGASASGAGASTTGDSGGHEPPTFSTAPAYKQGGSKAVHRSARGRRTELLGLSGISVTDTLSKLMSFARSSRSDRSDSGDEQAISPHASGIYHSSGSTGGLQHQLLHVSLRGSGDGSKLTRSLAAALGARGLSSSRGAGSGAADPHAPNSTFYAAMPAVLIRSAYTSSRNSTSPKRGAAPAPGEVEILVPSTALQPLVWRGSSADEGLTAAFKSWRAGHGEEAETCRMLILRGVEPPSTDFTATAAPPAVARSRQLMRMGSSARSVLATPQPSGSLTVSPSRHSAAPRPLTSRQSAATPAPSPDQLTLSIVPHDCDATSAFGSAGGSAAAASSAAGGADDTTGVFSLTPAGGTNRWELHARYPLSLVQAFALSIARITAPALCSPEA